MKSFLQERGIPANVLEDMDVHDNVVEVHRHMADFWIGLEGEATFTVGGELVESFVKDKGEGTINDLELRAKSTRGGETVVVGPGDWLWIPVGQLHVHSATGVARLPVFKIPQATVALEDVPGAVGYTVKKA